VFGRDIRNNLEWVFTTLPEENQAPFEKIVFEDLNKGKKGSGKPILDDAIVYIYQAVDHPFGKFILATEDIKKSYLWFYNRNIEYNHRILDNKKVEDADAKNKTFFEPDLDVGLKFYMDY